jgi:hypothetical protein
MGAIMLAGWRSRCDCEDRLPTQIGGRDTALGTHRQADFSGDLHDVLNEHDRGAVHETVVQLLDQVANNPAGPG